MKRLQHIRRKDPTDDSANAICTTVPPADSGCALNPVTAADKLGKMKSL